MARTKNLTPASEPDATALSMPLPGQAVEDATLIGDVVAAVNYAYETGGLQTMRQVGRIVLERMFDGDIGRFHDAEKGHASFRALAKHPDLRVSASNLWYAVAIEDNFRLLGGAADGLGASHHRRLVHVRDVAARAELAQQVVDQHLTVEELEEAIQSLKKPVADGGKRGRPPLAPAVKQFSALQRSTSGLAKVNPGMLDGIDAGKAAEMFVTAQALQVSLTEWLAEFQVELKRLAAASA